MELSPEGIIPFATGYIASIPSAILQGDIFALTITLIAFFIAVVIINRLTGLLIIVLKKIILLIIVTLAFWQFITLFYARVTTEGLTDDIIIFGAVGFVIGFIAISISLYVAIRSFYDARTSLPRPESGVQARTGDPQTFADISSRSGGMPFIHPTVPTPDATLAGESGNGSIISNMKETLSISSLKNDRSLGAVLAYLVIAQFGVYSSMTIPAPSFQVGVAFFAIFIIAGLFFIHFTYNNYLTGLRHLIMAILVGTTIAIILGHFWADIPLDQLLSPLFFQSDALVALVTGLALSLFMGGKG
jgi:hypothetical protein